MRGTAGRGTRSRAAARTPPRSSRPSTRAAALRATSPSAAIICAPHERRTSGAGIRCAATGRSSWSRHATTAATAATAGGDEVRQREIDLRRAGHRRRTRPRCPSGARRSRPTRGGRTRGRDRARASRSNRYAESAPEHSAIESAASDSAIANVAERRGVGGDQARGDHRQRAEHHRAPAAEPIREHAGRHLDDDHHAR